MKNVLVVSIIRNVKWTSTSRQEAITVARQTSGNDAGVKVLAITPTVETVWQLLTRLLAKFVTTCKSVKYTSGGNAAFETNRPIEFSA